MELETFYLKINEFTNLKVTIIISLISLRCLKRFKFDCVSLTVLGIAAATFNEILAYTSIKFSISVSLRFTYP
jgi:hypothetical protein